MKTPRASIGKLADNRIISPRGWLLCLLACAAGWACGGTATFPPPTDRPTDQPSPEVDAGGAQVDAGGAQVDAGAVGHDAGTSFCSAMGALQLSGITEAELTSSQLSALRGFAMKADLVKARFLDKTLYSLVLRRPGCLATDADLKLDESQGTLAGAKALFTRLRPVLGFDASDDLSNLTVRLDESLTSPLGTRYRRLALMQTYANTAPDGGVVLTFIDDHLASIDGPLLTRLGTFPDASFPPSGPATYPTWPQSTGMVDGELIAGLQADLAPGSPVVAQRISTRARALGSSRYALQEPGHISVFSAVADGGTLSFTTQACPTCFDAQPPDLRGGRPSAAYAEQIAFFAARQAQAMRDFAAQRFPLESNAPALVVTGCTLPEIVMGKFMPRYFGPTIRAWCGGVLPATTDGIATEEYPVILLAGTDVSTTIHEYGHLIDHFYSGPGIGVVQRDSKCPTGARVTPNVEALAKLYEAVGRNVSWGTGLFPNTSSVPTDPIEHLNSATLLSHPLNHDCTAPNRYHISDPGQQVIRELALNKNAAPSSRWAQQQGPLTDAAAARRAVLEAYFFASKFMQSDSSMPQFFDRFEQYYLVFQGDDAARYASEVIAHHSLD